MTRYNVLFALMILAACAPSRVYEEPVLQNGDRVPSSEAVAAAAAADTERDQAATAQRRDEIFANALATCAPRVCDAVTRGEVALGMNETQVLAATRTSEDAWSIRRSGASTVMVPRYQSSGPSDAVGEVAMVQARNGRVDAYSYTESQGVRLVTDLEDATTEGRADNLAEALIREGDQLAAAGDLDAALDRYDRADVLRTDDPMIDYRIATVLDKSLRPIEALIRYKLFLHRLDLERIDAVGDAYAKIVAAQVHARERIIVIEKHTQ